MKRFLVGYSADKGGCEALRLAAMLARAAGVATIAVSWGYHPVDRLEASAPDALVHDMAALAGTVAETLGL